MIDDAKTYNLEEIRAISHFSKSLAGKESVDEVLWAVTKNVVHEMGFVDCVIYRFNPERKILLQKAAYGNKNPAGILINNPITIALGEGIVGDVAQSGKSVLVNDTSKDARYIIDDQTRLSELCVPIIVAGQLFGVVDSEHPRKDFFTEKHLHLLTIIAALCAQKIKELDNRNKKRYTTADRYFRKLEYLMKVEKIYRDSNLSLGSTAEMLNISACYLSSMINAVLERSFIEYINGYRVDDVKNYLRSEEYDHYTIVSVGLEAGFNSKSAFYSAFKKQSRITPSQYKEQSSNGVIAIS